MKKPGVEKALLMLRKNIENGIWPKGSRIPKYTHLSIMAQVSPGTMLVAIDILRKEGLLTSKRKSGIFVGPQPPQQLPDAHRIQKWEKIKTDLHKDITEGIFHDQEYLPSIKELSHFYETGTVVIKKAIGQLVKEKMAAPTKRRFRIVTSRIKTPSNRLYLVLPQWILDGSMLENERIWIETLIESLEKNCSVKNISLTFYPFSLPIKNPDGLQDALGFIFWFSAEIARANPTDKELSDFFSAFARFKKPIAVFNSVGIRDMDLYSFSIKPSLRNCPVFLSDFNRDRLAGLAVGRHLIAKGHSTICYFAHGRELLYATERLEGIKEAYALAGIQHTIVPFFQSDFADENSEKNQVGGISSGVLDRKKRVLTDSITALQREQQLDNFYENTIVAHMHDLNYGVIIAQNFFPVFTKALTISKATAWACCDDHIALYGAKRFLAGKKIKSPEQIGLIGFGDLNKSSFSKLSSYHFDFARMARTIMNLVLYSGSRRNEKKFNRDFPEIFELDGMVIDRGSV